jgi:putative glutathione S-transferase
VYRCGFAKTQTAYDEASAALGNALEKMENILGKQRFLAGGVFTEADLRAFATLVRFDEVSD